MSAYCLSSERSVFGQQIFSEFCATVKSLLSAYNDLMNKMGSRHVGIIACTYGEGIEMPKRMSIGAASYDLCAGETVIIPAGKQGLVDTNLQMVIPEGFFAQLSKKCLMLIYSLK
jgi:hypothetical protein